MYKKVFFRFLNCAELEKKKITKAHFYKKSPTWLRVFYSMYTFSKKYKYATRLSTKSCPYDIIFDFQTCKVFVENASKASPKRLKSVFLHMPQDGQFLRKNVLFYTENEAETFFFLIVKTAERYLIPMMSYRLVKERQIMKIADFGLNFLQNGPIKFCLQFFPNRSIREQ